MKTNITENRKVRTVVPGLKEQATQAPTNDYSSSILFFLVFARRRRRRDLKVSLVRFPLSSFFCCLSLNAAKHTRLTVGVLKECCVNRECSFEATTCGVFAPTVPTLEEWQRLWGLRRLLDARSTFGNGTFSKETTLRRHDGKGNEYKGSKAV